MFKNTWETYWDTAIYIAVVFFLVWGILGIRHAQKTPSRPWAEQPTTELYLCGERMRPAEAARRAETEGSGAGLVPVLTPGDPEAPGSLCHTSQVWWTPFGRSEVQTEWGQPVRAPQEVLDAFRNSGWWRHWWDFPWDGEWN
jgi:hypothetical protein